MAEKVPQSFANHTRFDPPFHFFVLPVFAITAVLTIVHVVKNPSLDAALLAHLNGSLDLFDSYSAIHGIKESLRPAFRADPNPEAAKFR